MGKLVRRKFVGSKLLLVLFFVSGIGIPIAVVYFTECLITVEDDLEDPTEFLQKLVAGEYSKQQRIGPR